MNIDKCIRDIDFVHCGLPATRWFIGVRAVEWEPANLGVIPLCGHCAQFYSARAHYREVTREEAEIADVQEG